MSADQALQATLADLSAAFDELPMRAMVIGGIAVLAHGVARVTTDVDATVEGEGTDLGDLLATLARHGIEPRIADALAFARRSQVLLLRHRETSTPLEISLAWLPFEQEALARAVTVNFGTLRVRVARPEDLVVYKVAAWRDRDRSDVERLIRLHHRSIDLGRLRGLAAEIASALDEPERLAELDAVISRAVGEES